MYLKEIRLDNYGPVKSLIMRLKFNEDDTPTPTVLVGVNGSGKSILLSVILDAIIMTRIKAFGKSPEIREGQLFKPMSRRIITNQLEKFAMSKCKFQAKDKTVEFLEVISTPNKDGTFDLPPHFKATQAFQLSEFNRRGSSKSISVTGGNINQEMSRDIFAYYPAGRTERPNWLHEDATINFQISQIYANVARYHLWRTNLIAEISSWILDVVLDAEMYDKTAYDFPLGTRTVKAWLPSDGPSRKILNHLNLILTEIALLGRNKYKSVRLGVSPRHEGSRQVRVLGKKPDGTEEVISNTILDLSTGELMVFCMFADIIKLAELQGWDKKNLSDISGIVIIDEADLHLHINLQKSLLPKLMAKLPNIQFLLTTHSPFLTLGLSENEVDIKNMPDGVSISPYEFSEFREAYDTFIEQQDKFQETYDNLQNVLADAKRPLIVTEGKTDWRHLKKALSKLKEKGEFNGLNVDFHETDEQMGDGELDKLFEASNKLPHQNPIIFIFDRDNPRFVKKYIPDGYEFLASDSAIGMCLAVPDHRKDNPDICVEHLYTDGDLRTPVPNSQMRLRFEHEIAYSADRKTAFLRPTLGKVSLKIFDKNVAEISNEDGSQAGALAISKSAFFEKIVDAAPGENFDFEGFLPTLNLIKSALESFKEG